jgi:hypothetical protein
MPSHMEYDILTNDRDRLRAETERLTAALNRYRYAYAWWAADAFDGGGEMRSRFNWAFGEDQHQRMTEDEVAKVGQQFLEQTGRMPRRASGE